jgi:hypothetical protein
VWYYKARVYEPEPGRFLQPDPIGYQDSPNVYAYVLNDSINLIDPLGLEVWCGGTWADVCGRRPPNPIDIRALLRELDAALDPNRITVVGRRIGRGRRTGNVLDLIQRPWSGTPCPTGPRIEIGGSGGFTLFGGLIGISPSAGMNVSFVPTSGLRGMQISWNISGTALAGVGAFAGFGPSLNVPRVRNGPTPSGVRGSSSSVLQVGAGWGAGAEVSGNLSSQGPDITLSGGPKGAYGGYLALGKKWDASLTTEQLFCEAS